MTYQITVTETQARVLAQATEVLARLGIGQFRDALECLPKRECAPEGWHDDLNAIGKLLATYMIDGVDGYSRSLGIHNKDVSETSRIAWDLYQVLRHRLAWDRAVKYDEPMKSSNQPLVVMTKN